MRALLFLLMIFSQPVPFAEALESRAVRSVLPTTLSSAELAEIGAHILERATFSARVTNAEYLQTIEDVVRRYANGEIDLASARLELKNKLREIGYAPAPDEAGTLKDFGSDARTNLVLRTNSEMATGYGQWRQGQNVPVLDQWPAQELYRIAPRRVPRDWTKRWSEAASATGTATSGFVALKNSPIWTALSRFGTPYPPFDFNSGMGVRDIDRDAAMALGLIDRDTQIAPQDRGFNDDLQFKPEIRSAALRRAIEEEGYVFRGDVLTTGERVQGSGFRP